MKIFLAGGSGQLGHALRRSLAAHAEIVAPPRSRLDLADLTGLRQFVRAAPPQLIINAAAYTGVDLAESHREQAFLINEAVPRVLAEEAQRLGVGLIHFSTDYVFDGRLDRPYIEDDAVRPLNVYGLSKAAGEQAVAAGCEAYWTLRTSWLFGTDGENFITKILRLARQRDRLDVVDDQTGAPTAAATIAAVIGRMLAQARDTPDGLRELMLDAAGTYHLSSHGATTWHAYARHIVATANRLGMATRLSPQEIHPTTSQAYAAAARRPPRSLLSTRKIETRFNLELPQWDEAVDQYLSQLAAQAG